jgi:quercetin dioxygenase-like cupin family protein
MPRKAFFLLAVGSFLLSVPAFAGQLTEARVTKIVKEVKVVDPAAGTRPANLNDLIRDQIGVATGIQSRSELLFQDNTLTRLGPETYFSFKSGTRDLTLDRGTMLLQVPKGLGGAKIHTAAVTASITGTTIMMEYVPNRDIKVLVLEGTLRLSVNGRIGDSLLLQPGKMVIMPPNAKRIPDPVTVDLKKVVLTSTLVNMGHGKDGKAAPLPSMGLIAKEVEQQEKDERSHKVIPTNLVIRGKGTNVTLASDEFLQALAARTDIAKQNVLTATTSLNPAPTPAPTPPVTGSGGAGLTPPPAPLADIGPFPTIQVHDPFGHDPHTDVKYGDDGHPVSVPIVLNKPQDWSGGSTRGNIKIASNNSVKVNTTLKVSDVSSQRGGQISIDNRAKTGTAISVTDSGQLLALLNAASMDHGSMITFKSAGGNIDVNGGTIQADKGTIDIRNNGSSGVVNLNNATLNASTIKAGALGSNGTLNVGGGTISADNLIKLYAGGSNGTVNFIDNVTLDGGSVKTIAGDTVTVFNGKTVTVNGPAPANVFTNHPNYTGWGGNGSTTGTFAGQGAVTHPFNGAPGF